MGLFSSSKSRQRVTNITNTKTVGADNGSLAAAGNITINNGDASSVIRETNAFLGETFASALGLVEKQNQQFIEGIANDEIETRGELIAKLTPVALAVTVAFVGWKVLK